MIRIPGQELHTPLTFPAVLSKSRDYDVIEILLASVFNFFYIQAEESKNCHNPHRCEVDLLPMLADYYRYEYTDVQSVEMERDIIASVPNLHHEKGTATGVNNALMLSKVDKTDSVSIPWFYTPETNTVTVIVFNGLQTYKMYELLKLVIPLGTKVIFKPGVSIKASEEVQLHSWTEINFGYLDPDKQWCVTENNKFMTKWNPEDQLYHTYVDTQAHLDVARTGNIEVTDYNSVVNAIDEVKANTDVHIPGEGEN